MCSDLVASLDDAQMQTPVPACPAWRVHDLLCHLVGLPGDVNAGRIEGAGTDPWTAAQVAGHCDNTRDELLDEWEREAAPFEEIIPMIDPPRPSSTSSCTSKTCAARSACPAARDQRGRALARRHRAGAPRVRDRRSEPPGARDRDGGRGVRRRARVTSSTGGTSSASSCSVRSRVAAARTRSGRRAARSSTCRRSHSSRWRRTTSSSSCERRRPEDLARRSLRPCRTRPMTASAPTTTITSANGSSTLRDSSMGHESSTSRAGRGAVLRARRSTSWSPPAASSASTSHPRWCWRRGRPSATVPRCR